MWIYLDQTKSLPPHTVQRPQCRLLHSTPEFRCQSCFQMSQTEGVGGRRRDETSAQAFWNSTAQHSALPKANPASQRHRAGVHDARGPACSAGKLSNQLCGQLDDGLHFSLLSCWLRPQAGGLITEQARHTSVKWHSQCGTMY